MVRAVENAPGYLMKEGVAGLGGGVTGQDLVAYVAVDSLDSAVLEIQSAGAKGAAGRSASYCQHLQVFPGSSVQCYLVASAYGAEVVAAAVAAACNHS